MAFKQTSWEFSDEIEREELPSEGDRFLFIRNAVYDENTNRYYLYLTDVNENIPFMVSYNMNKVDKDTGAVTPNVRSRGTLISLNRALFDRPSGIPYPGDIIGGVVSGKVVHREFNGKLYVNIYTYSAVPEDIVLSYSQIDQYYIGYVPDDEDGAE